MLDWIFVFLTAVSSTYSDILHFQLITWYFVILSLIFVYLAVMAQ